MKLVGTNSKVRGRGTGGGGGEKKRRGSRVQKKEQTETLYSTNRCARGSKKIINGGGTRE